MRNNEDQRRLPEAEKLLKRAAVLYGLARSSEDQARVLTNLAEDLDAGLIVMGSHGRGDLTALAAEAARETRAVDARLRVRDARPLAGGRRAPDPRLRGHLGGHLGDDGGRPLAWSARRKVWLLSLPALR